MDTIAGYRILRKLGSGSRADVYLGYPEASFRGQESPQEPESTQQQRGEHGADAAIQRPVALKIFHPSTPHEGIDGEARALANTANAGSAHLVTLRDIAAVPGERIVFVLPQLSAGSLTQFLERRDEIGAGEAVTILAPIAQAVSALHASGFAHTRVSTARVLFDDRGAPVLTGLGHCVQIPIGKPSRPIPHDAPERAALAGDIRGLAGLVGQTLSRVTTGIAKAEVMDLEQWLRNGVDARRLGLVTDELEERLFALATPTPVELAATIDLVSTRADRVPSRAALPVSGRLRAASVPTTDAPSATSTMPEGAPSGAPAAARSAADPAAESAAGWSAVLHLPGELTKILEGLLGTNPLAKLVKKYRARLAHHRKPVWFACGVAVVLLAIVFTTLPQAGGTPIPDAAADESRGPAADASATPTAASRPASSIGAQDAETIRADDPAQAAQVLLRLRSQCLANASIICLDGVDQDQSALMDADRYRIRQGQQIEQARPSRGGSLNPAHASYADHTAALAERSGDAALVTLQPAVAVKPGEPEPADSDVVEHATRQPVSVLLMKGETGWRLRDLFDY